MRVQRRQQPKPEPVATFEVVSTLRIPDELIEWGREPQRAMFWPFDWASEVRKLAEAGAVAPLPPDASERLLARLEALVSEAISAGRSDLLVGLDVQTAEWLGLRYHQVVGGRDVSVGRGGDVSWREVRVLLDAKTRGEATGAGPDPKLVGDVALRVKDLVTSVFPQAEIVGVEPEVARQCSTCGEGLSSVSIVSDLGFEYCRACWAHKTEPFSAETPPPKNRKPGRR